MIFICTYDPFGKGRKVYTLENRCIEDTSIALGDEATKIILNAKGTVGEVNEELGNVLRNCHGIRCTFLTQDQSSKSRTKTAGILTYFKV